MPIKPRPVYEPHTIPELWESYQATLNLGVEGKPYINEHDFILILQIRFHCHKILCLTFGRLTYLCLSKGLHKS